MDRTRRQDKGTGLEAPRADYPPGDFFTFLLAANHPRLDGFKQWWLQPGMLFQSRQQWWGRKKLRASPHEGLDLCWYLDEAGNCRALDSATAIPVPFPGVIGHLCGDFLGESIFVDHALPVRPGWRLVTAFGHTTPRAGLAVGQRVMAGEIIATISSAVGRRSVVPPHLHLTLAEVPDAIPTVELTWARLGAVSDLILLDPLKVFFTSYVMA